MPPFQENSMKQNITLTLEQDLLEAAQGIAARYGTRLDDLMAEALKARIQREYHYEQDKQDALDLLENPWSMGGQGMGRREDLHDRSALR